MERTKLNSRNNREKKQFQIKICKINQSETTKFTREKRELAK